MSEFGQTRSTIGIAAAAPGSLAGRSVAEMFDWDVNRSLSEMTLFFQAIGYYGLDEHLNFLDYYLSGPEIDAEEIFDQEGALSKNASTQERFERLKHEFNVQGIDPIAFDYSHPDWAGLIIMKVFVPELTTPFLQSRPMLGHPRLNNIRQSLRAGRYVIPLPYA